MPQVVLRHIDKTYPDGTVAVEGLNLTVEDGEFLCVLGPSGCGKSSTLRMLAGLESISSGDLLLDGQRINDVPPQARDMAMVFENYALYPHLKVFDNIAMPLVARGLPRGEIRRRVEAVAETLQITEHLSKRPHKLSGGQRQRVALGRATTFYITHDQEEAAAVADRIAVMQDGRLQQEGSLLDLLDRPVNRFVAEFIGDLPINMLPATPAHDANGPALQVGDALLPLSPEQWARLEKVGGNAALTFGIRPEDVDLASEDGPQTLGGRVAVLEPQGDTTVVIGDTALGRVSAVVPSEFAPNPGISLHYRFNLARAHVFTADGLNLMLDGSGRRPTA